MNDRLLSRDGTCNPWFKIPLCLFLSFPLKLSQEYLAYGTFLDLFRGFINLYNLRVPVKSLDIIFVDETVSSTQLESVTAIARLDFIPSIINDFDFLSPKGVGELITTAVFIQFKRVLTSG